MRAHRTKTILLRAGLVVLGTLAVLLVVVALALPGVARKKTREALDGLEGARGDFQDVQVGLFPPRYTITHLKITATDHEGGGWVQIFQVKDGKFAKETDWFRAYPEVVAAAVKKAE